jgi:hypothetical protein
MKVTSGSINECVQTLRSNQLLMIAPGGVREAIFSRDYEIMWGKRKGFAEIAIKAKVVSINFLCIIF